MDFQSSPLKWVGGKGRVLPHLVPLLNQHKDQRLVEPFFGAGNVFLNTQHQAALLSDANRDVVLFHQFLKHHKDNFIKSACAWFTPENNTEQRYYELRELFNTTDDDWTKASLFLYLNKHAFNGLCRYNKKGKYNVGYGFYKAPNAPVAALNALADRLAPKHVEVVHMDFKDALKLLREDDNVYLDPPYTPASATANFTSYTVDGFGHEDHLTYLELTNGHRGSVFISNHDLPVVREMYQGYTFHSIDVSRTVSCKAETRGTIKELIAVKGR